MARRKSVRRLTGLLAFAERYLPQLKAVLAPEEFKILVDEIHTVPKDCPPILTVDHPVVRKIVATREYKQFLEQMDSQLKAKKKKLARALSRRDWHEAEELADEAKFYAISRACEGDPLDVPPAGCSRKCKNLVVDLVLDKKRWKNAQAELANRASGDSDDPSRRLDENDLRLLIHYRVLEEHETLGLAVYEMLFLDGQKGEAAAKRFKTSSTAISNLRQAIKATINSCLLSYFGVAIPVSPRPDRARHSPKDGEHPVESTLDLPASPK